MRLSELVVLAIAVGIALAGFALGRSVQNRFFQGKTLEAQRPWELLVNVTGVLWVFSQIAVGRAIRTGGFTHQFQLVLGIAVGALLGLATIWAFHRWLLAADEFIRRIETEAVALALGLGAVGIIAAFQLGSAGIGFFADTDGPPGARILLIMFFCYAISRVTVYLRYR